MVHRCSNCGFKADDASFFRRERGGAFNLAQTVCKVCSPYQPTESEKALAPRLVMAQATWFLIVCGTIISGHMVTALSLSMIALTALLTYPLRALLHEAGHAVTAKALGRELLEVRIGSGPLVYRYRLAGIMFDIRRYLFNGGLTRHFDPLNRATRLRSALITAAGPAVNILLVILPVIILNHISSRSLDELLSGSPRGIPKLINGQFVVQSSIPNLTLWLIIVTLIGFGLGNFATMMQSLWPRPATEKNLASDGWKLLNARERSKPYTAEEIQFLKVRQATDYQQYEVAISAASADLYTSSNKLYYASLIIHNMSRSRGERVAVDFYLSNLEQLLASNEDAVPGALAFLHANVAWSAIKCGDEDLKPLAEESILTAYAALPDLAEVSGTYGAWLVTVARAAEGMPLLIDAVRRISTYMERAEQAGFLARGARQLGDHRQAALFDAVAAHIMATRR